MSPLTEIILIAMVTAVACALPGAFLVLRRVAMISDAITHTVLLGIVLAFFVVRDTTSPLLVMAAATAGVATVALIELLNQTGRVREDAAIGLVFPFLFSIAVILIAQYAGNVHLDVDAVLLGELAFAPLDRYTLGDIDLGPRALWLMSGILGMSLLLLILFYKELKLATFDAALAATLGFMPTALHYGLMSVVSLTAVGAFNAVGSVLVVALMVAPPAAAYLLTDRLSHMLALSAIFGALAAILGCAAAFVLDTSLAGAMAVVSGLIFGVAWVFAPERGLVAQALRHARQRQEFAQAMLLVHLLHHEATPQARVECHPSHLSEHLRWNAAFTTQILHRAEQHGLLERQRDLIVLTESGRRLAVQTLGGEG
ncbi:iron chelate uptake ABC transporter family permease subunit [Roseiflexus castenholzii]|jgi:manganese/zinc/iron transport system permease protein|uniref:Transcriptional regulator, MarR family n=1 Tax=Roseiflexus castenholzii (strain DSM 13941 / HLO8) TaxID=383372 RepID=A7NJZ3_ROSCS|nr:iron chelate uptake ABC transporter family permease subunit [Roseiflexus castenholzii]ABU57813.1 transcriptional regulator, MarR family [Roseiflexus castenholzii DSM 13941]